MRFKKVLLPFLGALSLSLTGCSIDDKMSKINGSSNETNEKQENDDIKNIYRSYLSNGGTLSYEDWLNSIKGEKGDKGDQGPAGKDGKDGTDGVDGKDGVDGQNGSNGQDGVTPHIGSNGNWWIGTTDTGVAAHGTAGQNGKDGNDAITYIPCIFNNWNGTKLYEFYYEKGSNIVYDGPIPTRESDWDGEEELPYTFKGWDKSLENIQTPTIFTAQYSEKMYLCTFVNYDGTTLKTEYVERGHDASYTLSDPARPSEGNVEWTFTGWDKPLTNIKQDTVFTAQFYAPNAYKCTFKNENGDVLYTTYVGGGDRAVYEGATPTKDEVNNEGVITKYEFNGWDKSLKNINCDTEFIAQFTSTIYYECIFQNYDGTELYRTSTFGGGQATYKGATPIKPQSVVDHNVTDYTFSTWDKSLSNINAPTTFTATFSSNSYTGYNVTFKDINGTELYAGYFKSGTAARYPYETYYIYDSTNVTMFSGWDKSISNITEDIVVNEKRATISRRQNGEYPQTKVTDNSLINALNSISSTDSQGYKSYNNEKYLKYSSNYYKVEPIKWDFLSNDNDACFVAAHSILDAHRYDDNSNNYKDSEIREWLNGDFFDQAFYYDDSLVLTTAVDNSVASTLYSSNPYVCETTNDKIFLLSAQELTNPAYGFNSSYLNNDTARRKQPTDYAKARGCGYISDSNSEYYGNGYYWTRSPGYDYSYGARYVDYDGGVRGYSGVGYSGYGVLPALRLSL